jgi:hypothetical protein
MTGEEKRLYHQIHPLKLGIDISASIISLFFFWEHRWGIALATHLLPPFAASFLLMKYANLERQKNSAFGRYVKRHMSASVVLGRMAGDAVTVFAAWFHQALMLGTGVGIIVAAWVSGLN